MRIRHGHEKHGWFEGFSTAWHFQLLYPLFYNALVKQFFVNSFMKYVNMLEFHVSYHLSYINFSYILSERCCKMCIPAFFKLWRPLSYYYEYLSIFSKSFIICNIFKFTFHERYQSCRVYNFTLRKNPFFTKGNLILIIFSRLQQCFSIAIIITSERSSGSLEGCLSSSSFSIKALLLNLPLVLSSS